MDTEKALEFAVNIAKQAGRIQKERYEDGSVSIKHKGVIDLVTEVDLECEKLITSAIMEEYPEHGIMAEEGTSRHSDAQYVWIVDPLDGTTNFAHGFPFFCVSIALARDGEPFIGVVFDPLRGELFSGVKGGGAYLNGARLRVSGVEKMDDALLGTGFPYDIRTTAENNLDNFKRVAMHCQAIRRAGSAALDLCYVACGRFEGFWEQSLYAWDMAAGALFVREAGGIISDMKGKQLDLNGKTVAAGNPNIHPKLLKLLHMDLREDRG